jgi:hypothetical protein
VNSRAPNLHLPSRENKATKSPFHGAYLRPHSKALAGQGAGPGPAHGC